MGYKVITASNGEEALTIVQDDSTLIDLAITDVVMPQMSGREFVEHLTKLRPTVKVIYMSGYTDDAIVRHGLIDQKIAFVQKPFSADVLARKVREVLDSVPENGN
jgi:YesN/AraC family two-component response regulator